MEQFGATKRYVSKAKEQELKKSYEKCKEIISTLPKEKDILTESLRQYKGFWFEPGYLEGIMLMDEHFEARPTDVFIVTSPKSGTTWFKALIFAIINRTRYDNGTHPLLNSNPHVCVPFLETLYKINPALEDAEPQPSPCILGSHTPYTLLPKSIIASGSQIVYVCRNPKDVFVSLFHFMQKVRSKDLPPISLEEAFDMFIKGVSPFGPFWDHVLGYWKASLECPDKVLFVKYEDMKSDPYAYVKKMAEFLDHGFSAEEEEKGVVNEILQLCSFDNLSKLEINQTGTYRDGIENNVFFRKGKVGDWANHLTSEMIECLDKIIKEKFHGTGFSF